MEGKGVVWSNVRNLGKQINHATNDYSKTYGVIRRNVREAWKLEKSRQEIDEKKNQLKHMVERMENDLIIEAGKIQRTSGNLVSNKKIAKNGLPTVIISPATTRRSKLPWKTHGKSPITRQTSMPYVSKEITAKVQSSLSSKALPTLPRLQTAMGDLNNNSTSVSMYCRKVRHEHKHRETIDDLIKTSANDDKESPSYHLLIPPRDEKSEKDKLENDNNSIKPAAIESAPEAHTKMRKKKLIGRRATINW